MAGTSIDDQLKALVNQATSSSNGGTAGAQSVAAARALADQYLQSIEKDLQATMRQIGYKPGGAGKVYVGSRVAWAGRTGQYPSSTQISPIVTVGNQVQGTVGYKPYRSSSFLGQGSVDIPSLFEEGYSVKPGLSFSERPYFGHRTGWHIMQMVANRWVHQGAAQGVTITYNP